MDHFRTYLLLEILRILRILTLIDENPICDSVVFYILLEGKFQCFAIHTSIFDEFDSSQSSDNLKLVIHPQKTRQIRELLFSSKGMIH